MAITNRERVGKALEPLKTALQRLGAELTGDHPAGPRNAACLDPGH